MRVVIAEKVSPVFEAKKYKIPALTLCLEYRNA